MLISALISTLVLSVSPTLSIHLSLSLVKYHQPITNDCSVVAYVTLHLYFFLDIVEEEDRKKKGIIEKSGGCYKTNDMTFYLPTQLLVSDTTCS